MNYSQIIDALDNATAFDLFRVHVAVGNMLDDPKRVMELRSKLTVGSEIEYFLPDENRTEIARVIAFKRTRVDIQNISDNKRYTIPYYFININRVDTQIESMQQQAGLSRNEVKVGDRVAFLDRQNQEIAGIVKRLNQKTVTVDTPDTQWRVAYQYLFKVLSPDVHALENKSQ